MFMVVVMLLICSVLHCLYSVGNKITTTTTCERAPKLNVLIVSQYDDRAISMYTYMANKKLTLSYII